MGCFMNDNKSFITIGYSQSLEDVIGKIEWVPDEVNPKAKVFKNLLDRHVIAPSVRVHEDGTREVVGWSLILGRSHKFPFEKEKEKRELLCEVCDRDYPIWYAPNPLWNKVMRWPDGREASEKIGFICPTCFAMEAERLGIRPKGEAWVLDLEERNQ